MVSFLHFKGGGEKQFPPPLKKGIEGGFIISPFLKGGKGDFMLD